MLPERRPANHLQGIEAAQASPVKPQSRLQQQAGANARPVTAIRNPAKNLLRKVKDLFRVSDQSSENRLLLSLLQALPLPIGQFFDQPFHLLVVLDGLPHALFPLPRHEQLAQLPPLAPNQVEAGMELSPGATTTGFAAANVPQREGATEKAGSVHDLRQAGPAPTFPIREVRPVQGTLPYIL